MNFIKPGRVIDFMAMRRFWIALSVSLVVISAVLIWKPGPRYGIDFLGGTELTVKFNNPVDPGRVRASFNQAPDAQHPNRFYDPGVEIVPNQADPSSFIIRVERASHTVPEPQLRAALAQRLGDVPITEFAVSPGGDHIMVQLGAAKTEAEVATLVRDAGAPVRGDAALRVGAVEEHRWQVPLRSVGDDIFEQLKADLNTDGQLLASVWVSPRAGKELRDQAIKAVLYSIVFIMIYVAFRFDLRFAPGGILALFHDAIVTVGFFVLTRKEITISTVAAILTVIGYSMNDTVIVYDRVRENLTRRRGLRMLDVINVSVSEMFSRTIITSTTVILSVVPFTIFGSGVIQNFAWAMIVGVLAGTYSSIYVAAPLTEWIDSKYFHDASAPPRPNPPVSDKGAGATA